MAPLPSVRRGPAPPSLWIWARREAWRTPGRRRGLARRSYEPMATADTTDLRYWLRWRVGLCSVWVLACMAITGYLIWHHEGAGADRRPGDAASSSSGPAAADSEPGAGGKGWRRPGVLYDGEAWRPCLQGIHPAWLLAYRLISFVLLSLLVVIVISDGGSIFYYYTQ